MLKWRADAYARQDLFLQIHVSWWIVYIVVDTLLVRRLPDTTVMKTSDPLQTFEAWLYDQRQIEAHPHVVLVQEGNIMHGFMDVIVPLSTGVRK